MLSKQLLGILQLESEKERDLERRSISVISLKHYISKAKSLIIGNHLFLSGFYVSYCKYRIVIRQFKKKNNTKQKQKYFSFIKHFVKC